MRMTVPIRVRWADLDAYGHVNNVAMITLLEEARIAVLWHASDGDVASGHGAKSAWSAATDVAAYVVSQQVEYLKPLGYPRGPLEIQLWVSRIGVSSIDVCYEVPALEGGVAARAMTTVVMVNLETGKPRRLTAEERQGLSGLLEEAIEFRTRA